MPFENRATVFFALSCRTGCGRLFSEPVAVALGADDVGVVDDPVDHGLDHDQVLEAAIDHLKEQVRGILVKRDIADFIDHQETVAA